MNELIARLMSGSAYYAPEGDNDGARDFTNNDGSMVDAVRDMPDFGYLDGEKATPVRSHAPDGKFQREDSVLPTEKDPKAKTDNVVEMKPKAPEPADEDDDEDDEVEWTPEGSEEPQRAKLSDLLASHTRVKSLEGELETVRKAAPVPVDYEAALREIVPKQIQYTKALEDWARFNMPQAPSQELLDKRSEKYDPDLYAELFADAQAKHARIEQIKAEHARITKEAQDGQAVLDRIYDAREAAARKELWPEYETESGRKAAYDDVEKHYGLKGEDLDTVKDHRAVKIIRDALAYQKLIAKQQEAVKQVRSKPKLIQGKARGAGDNRSSRAADAMGRLSKSGNMDDAADAIGNILR